MDAAVLKQTLRGHLQAFFPNHELLTWFEPLVFELDTETKNLRVTFPHALFERWFMQTIQSRFEEHCINILGVLTVQYGAAGSCLPPRPQEQSAQTLAKESNKIPPAHKNTTATIVENQPSLPQSPVSDHTFDTFLVNTKNDFPVAAAKETCFHTGTPLYTPFVIYGQSGSGKTHLLEAMANAIIEQTPVHGIFVGSCDEFFQTVETTGNKKIPEYLSQAYFIDDLQRIYDNASLQKRLVIHMDALHRAGKLIAITLDCHPNTCRELLPALCTRLISGLVVELKKPDIDIRRQYIQQMNAEFSLELSKDEVLTLAQRFHEFRTIIGALTRIKAYRLLLNQEDASIDQILNIADEHKVLTPTIIVDTTAKYYGVTAENILSKSRSKKVTMARQAAIYLCRDLLGLSLVQIGHFFNGRDHSSIVYTIKKVKELQQSNKVVNNDITQLKKLCLSGSVA